MTCSALTSDGAARVGGACGPTVGNPRGWGPGRRLRGWIRVQEEEASLEATAPLPKPLKASITPNKSRSRLEIRRYEEVYEQLRAGKRIGFSIAEPRSRTKKDRP